jgi:hypothetical protein
MGGIKSARRLTSPGVDVTNSGRLPVGESLSLILRSKMATLLAQLHSPPMICPGR